MSNVYLISTADLKANSVININIDDKYLKPAILVAQDLVIERLYGTDLYNEVKSQITGSTLTTANTTLLEKSKSVLIYWSLYHSLNNNYMKITEIGIGQKSTVDYQPIDLDTFNKLKDDIRNLAEEYSQRLKNFLIEAQSDYPAYSTNADYDDIMPDTGSQYFSGIQLKTGGCGSRMSQNKRNTLL